MFKQILHSRRSSSVFAFLLLFVALLVYAGNLVLDEDFQEKKTAYELADGKLEAKANFLNDLVVARENLNTRHKSKNDSIGDILAGAIETCETLENTADTFVAEMNKIAKR